MTLKNTLLAIGLTAILASVQSMWAAPAPVTTYHNDNSRTGVNNSETILNTSNVNTATFGKLYSLPVDGQIYAQLLYVPSVNISGGAYPGTHNVLFAATMHNTVYAFDADSSTPMVLWSTNLGTPVPCTQLSPSCNEGIEPEVGILSTPVIDIANHSIFLVAETQVSSTETAFALHSLDITTGLENANSPVSISGQVAGTGFGNVNGVISFDPNWHLQRTGLTLLRGNIYFGFGSHGDQGPWHGWIFGYNETTLSQILLKCMSPNFYGNAVWQGGAAFSTDNASNLYIQTGNGNFNASTGGPEWGEALIKLNTVTNTYTSYFVPTDETNLDNHDWDISAAGSIVLPSTSPLVAPMIVGGGKYGVVYLMNTANLKGYSTVSDQVVQEFQSLTAPNPDGGSAHYGGSVFYDNALYTWGSGDFLKRWAFNGKLFSATPASVGTYQEFPYETSAPAMSLSANGTVAGSGILWAMTTLNYSGDAWWHGVLHAYDAANVANELWNSDISAADFAGSMAKFNPPTIANGKVYVPTDNCQPTNAGEITVFGLKNPN